jgi:FAD dependent oxidoreductase
MRELHADVVIIGGGTGGCAAALAAAKSGKSVIMTEETDWIGGQFTSQAVPPDEHPWIEQFGCTRSYRTFRDSVRDYYRNHYPMTAEARVIPNLDPGNGSVSRLCHEPKVALAVFYQMLAPYINSGRLTILTNHKLHAVRMAGDNVLSITVEDRKHHDFHELVAPYFLDATECGDVLPQAGVEYVLGAESVDQTGEPNAVVGPPQPNDIQAFTYCFAMDYLEGENHTIAKPETYDFWRNYKADFWPDKLLSWTGSNPRNTAESVRYELFPGTKYFPLFTYRQIADPKNFQTGLYKSGVSMVNWPQNDYWLGSIIDVPEEERQRHLYGGKQLSLSLLYWMQTEAPCPDGGQGYPGLRLRKDVVGTEDGLAMYPYIRESRRIKAEFTVLEQHVSAFVRNTGKAEAFHDSVGVGSYRIDLHPSTANRNYVDVSTYPFQIPLGSLIPVRVNNLLPAGKNLGVTHITNGCFRLHPVEWNVGEVAGYLTAYCLQYGLTPRAVRNTPDELKKFQAFLYAEGVEYFWPTMYAV